MTHACRSCQSGMHVAPAYKLRQSTRPKLEQNPLRELHVAICSMHMVAVSCFEQGTRHVQAEGRGTAPSLLRCIPFGAFSPSETNKEERISSEKHSFL